LRIAGHQVAEDNLAIEFRPVEAAFHQIGGGNQQIVEVRPEFEMPHADPGTARDVEHGEFPSGGLGDAGPVVDILSERIVARLAQAIEVAARRIDAECMMRLWESALCWLNSQLPATPNLGCRIA